MSGSHDHSSKTLDAGRPCHDRCGGLAPSPLRTTSSVRRCTCSRSPAPSTAARSSPRRGASTCPPLDGLMMFHVVTAGRCWLEVDGHEPLLLQPGSLTLVPHGTPHRLRSDLDAPSSPAVRHPRRAGQRPLRDHAVRRRRRARAGHLRGGRAGPRERPAARRAAARRPARRRVGRRRRQLAAQHPAPDRPARPRRCGPAARW